MVQQLGVNNQNQRLLAGRGRRPESPASSQDAFVANVAEKRYLWTARAFAIITAVSLCCNIVLLLAIAQGIPLYRVEPVLLTFQNKQEQVYNIQPVNRDMEDEKEITEVFVREYVLLRSSSATFMYRDFQSRNVMIKDGEPWFIDFQGGRKGPFYYDVASFLWQAKAKYPDSLRKELLQEYMDALRKYQPIDEPYFYSQLRHFVLFRTLQVLGAYGFRGYFEKKPHFIQSVPFAIQNLRDLLKEAYPEYPYLCWVLRELTELKQFTDDLKKRQLTVKVMSFAYKKGIPDDSTGNGGGYVFDCRAVNNPGKYERYKPFTGLDEPVIRFLEEDGEILRFLESVYALVDASVKRYMERGFSNLSVCFGCTGGQHRSVYSAQHLAEHLNRKFGVKVELVHREQNIERTFEAIV